jgi:hypothetical protein
MFLSMGSFPRLHARKIPHNPLSSLIFLKFGTAASTIITGAQVRTRGVVIGFSDAANFSGMCVGRFEQ